jgi:serine/threonine-protein kinase/endoribonuclease IRE1
MKIRWMITPTIGWLALLAFLMPASAMAGSLLSGYGGPGEGNQAILGSALVNGGGGGGGRAGGGGGSGGGTSTGAGQSATVVAQSSAAHASGSPTARHAGAHPARANAPRSAARVIGTSAGIQLHPASARGGASQPASSSGSLGLTGADFLYILLAVAALVLTGVLTKRMARHHGEQPG